MMKYTVHIYLFLYTSTTLLDASKNFRLYLYDATHQISHLEKRLFELCIYIKSTNHYVIMLYAATFCKAISPLSEEPFCVHTDI